MFQVSAPPFSSPLGNHEIEAEGGSPGSWEDRWAGVGELAPETPVQVPQWQAWSNSRLALGLVC